jgi:hypothetical protein
MPAKILILMALTLVSAGCTHLQLTKPEPTCNTVDWWEAGRTDGVAGLPVDRLKSYDCPANPSQVDLYTNGREAGLVDYCSPAQALANGRAGNPYLHVCPENLEPAFLTNYKTGQRIRQLEVENSDLQARIENLVHLMSESKRANNLKNQVETLRTRRAQNSGEIVDLESNSISF